jgi:hypothetical protein
MVGNGKKLLDKLIEEIQLETNIELAGAARLAREVERGKRHNSMQDDSGASEDEPEDGTLVRRHHPKFNSRCPTDRHRLQNRSRSIHDKDWLDRPDPSTKRLSLKDDHRSTHPPYQKTMKKLTHT